MPCRAAPVRQSGGSRNPPPESTGVGPPVTERPVTGADAGDRRVVFTPSGIDVTVPAGTSVLDAARAGGVDVDSVCGGRGLCGRCQIVPALGRHAKWGITVAAEALSAPGEVEAGYRGRRPLAEGHRLGCQALVAADVVVDVPASSAVRRPVVRKAIDLGDVVLDPVVTLHYLELPPAVLGDEVSDADRVTAALAADWGLDGVAVPLGVSGRPAGGGGRRRRGGDGGRGGRAPPAGGPPRLLRRGVGRGHRRGVHHPGGLPAGPGDRRGGRHGGAHEPADPLRRGPHEPGVVRDDEPRRGGRPH